MSDHEIPLPGQVGQQFLAHARLPRNLGTLSNPTGQATEVGQCGDSVDVFIRVENEAIAEIKALPHGCVYTVVCASALGDLARGLGWSRPCNWSPRTSKGSWAACPRTTSTAPAWR